MSNPQNHVHPAHLLERTAWLKELARALVTDEARADDLVQQTLLQSIEKPGTQGTLAPSWFAKVLRNFAYKTHREERNRKRREQAVARREKLSVTPAEITERAELHREIVDLVLQLDEPYRSTVLFRYFQGLNLREIAEQERTPITTVRSRLRNALEQLRVRLDGKCGGERQAWQAALIPLLDSHVSTPGSSKLLAAGEDAATRLERSKISGTALAARTMKVIVPLAVGMILVMTATIVTIYQTAGPSTNPDSRVAGVPLDGAKPVVSRFPPIRRAEEPADLKEETTAAEDLSPNSSIGGTVRDVESGAGIPGAIVRLGRWEATTDVTGIYLLSDLAEGTFKLVASAEGYAPKRLTLHVRESGDNHWDLDLDPAMEVHVQVVDGAGRPMEEAIVWGSRSDEPEWWRRRLSVTDESGQATIFGVSRLNPRQLWASRQEGAPLATGEIEIDHDESIGRLRIKIDRTEPGDQIVFGRIVDRRGSPIPGVTVQARILSPEVGTELQSTDTVSDEGGYYRVAFKVGDRYFCAMSVSGPGWAPVFRQVHRVGGAKKPVEVNFTLSLGNWLAGKVTDEKNTPVAGARVTVGPSRGRVGESLFPGAYRQADTDSGGNFRLENLQGPEVALDIAPPEGSGLLPSRKEEVNVGQFVPITLMPPGVIRGRVLDADRQTPVRVFIVFTDGGDIAIDRMEVGESFATNDGSFVLTDLNPQYAFDLVVESDGYVSAEIKNVVPQTEGGSEELSIALRRGRLVKGLVVNAVTNEPVAGASIVFRIWDCSDFSWTTLDGQKVTTGSDGSFDLRETELLTLFVSAEGYRPLLLMPDERPAYGEPSGELLIPLTKGEESISGVCFENGAPLANSYVFLSRLTSCGEWQDDPILEMYGGTRADDDGRFSWGNLRPGVYKIGTSRNGPGDMPMIVFRESEVKPGEHKVVNFGNELGELNFTGRLVDSSGQPLHHFELTLKPAFEWDYSEFATTVLAEHDGSFHFQGLRPGTYTVGVVPVVPFSRPRCEGTIRLPSIELTENTERQLQVALE